MNKHIINDLISRFAEKQKHGWHLCPRCGADKMNKDAARNALSRRADIMICNICGTVEAIEDAERAKKLPLDRWVLAFTPEKFFLKNKDFFDFYFTFGSWKGFPFQNAYIVVEAFSKEDAYSRFRCVFPDKNPGIACYSFDYTDEAWKATSMSKKLPCAGVLHLNGSFERAE